MVIMPETNNINADRALLEERLKKLDQKKFDWSAWKKGTLLVLEKIFGKNSLYVKELVNTDYHHSSWSLRDTAGSEDPVKSSARELLNICLTDVENRDNEKPGETTAPRNEEKGGGQDVLQQFLDQASLEELTKLVKADKPAMIKEEQIRDFIKEKLPKHQEVMLGKILLWMLQE